MKSSEFSAHYGKSNQVLTSSFYFKKAFDEVPYLRLLRKIRSYCMNR